MVLNKRKNQKLGGLGIEKIRKELGTGKNLIKKILNSWLCFSPAAALGRAGPEPHLDSTGELALVAGVQVGCLEGMTMGELFQPLMAAIG